MDPKLQEQLNEQELKINQIHQSVRKIEWYLKLTFWVTVVVVVLPILIAIFMLPPLLSSYLGTLDSLMVF